MYMGDRAVAVIAKIFQGVAKDVPRCALHDVFDKLGTVGVDASPGMVVGIHTFVGDFFTPIS